jgi:hypothetical protein
MGAIAFSRFYNGGDETILPEPEKRKPIISAIELPYFCRGRTDAKWPVFHVIDPPDVCGDTHIFKVAGPQSRAPIPQCHKRLIKTVPQRRHKGIAGENDWRTLAWACATAETGLAFHCRAINQTIGHGAAPLSFVQLTSGRTVTGYGETIWSKSLT